MSLASLAPSALATRWLLFVQSGGPVAGPVLRAWHYHTHVLWPFLARHWARARQLRRATVATAVVVAAAMWLYRNRHRSPVGAVVLLAYHIVRVAMRRLSARALGAVGLWAAASSGDAAAYSGWTARAEVVRCLMFDVLRTMDLRAIHWLMGAAPRFLPPRALGLPPGAVTRIDTAKFRGVWYESPASRQAAAAATAATASPSGVPSPYRVLLYFHGGGFALGTAEQYPGLMGAAMDACARAGVGPFRVLSVEYSLTTPVADESRPAANNSSRSLPRFNSPFPHALHQCLDAYLYLVHELRVLPANIVVAGDSAGGNLAIGVTQLLRDRCADAVAAAATAAASGSDASASSPAAAKLYPALPPLSSAAPPQSDAKDTKHRDITTANVSPAAPASKAVVVGRPVDRARYPLMPGGLLVVSPWVDLAMPLTAKSTRDSEPTRFAVPNTAAAEAVAASDPHANTLPPQLQAAMASVGLAVSASTATDEALQTYVDYLRRDPLLFMARLYLTPPLQPPLSAAAAATMGSAAARFEVIPAGSARDVTAPHSPAVTNPLVSPARMTREQFAGFPHTCVWVGGREVFRDDIRQWSRAARAAGVRVREVFVPSGIHVAPLLAEFAAPSPGDASWPSVAPLLEFVVDIFKRTD